MGAFRSRQQQTRLVYDLLPPERSATARPHPFAERKREILDAEFVILPAARGANARAGNTKDRRRAAACGTTARRTAARGNAPGRGAIGPAMLSILAWGLRLAELWLQRASPRAFAALVLAMATLVFSLCGGFSGFSGGHAAPLSDPLQFTHVTLTPRDANGMRVLVLNGIVENDGPASMGVRPIRADLVAGDRVLSSIVVAAPAERIAAGESRGFSARLPHPGGKIPDVRLSFMP